MTNVPIRGLSSAAVERIDAETSALGLSRNEFLRRARSAAACDDLADPEVMDAAAWR